MVIGPGYGGGGYGVGGYGAGGALPGVTPSLGYYLNLITSEYQNSPQFLAMLQVYLRPFVDAAVCLSTMVDYFDIDEATGVQLDALGIILGASRTVQFQPSNNVSPILDDATYRILLKAKIAQNQWNGQAGSLFATWQNLFPGGTIYVIDNQNMTATIILAGLFTSIIKDLIVNGFIVPRPETVLYTYTFATLPLFGFDGSNPALIAGFDVGHWA